MLGKQHKNRYRGMYIDTYTPHSDTIYIETEVCAGIDLEYLVNQILNKKPNQKLSKLNTSLSKKQIEPFSDNHNSKNIMKLKQS